MIESGIYKITQLDTGKVYVGSSINIKKRWKQHIGQLKCNSHGNRELQADVNTYGIESLEFQILELVSPDNKLLSVREKFWQNCTGSSTEYNKKGIIRRESYIKDSFKMEISAIDFVKIWQCAKSVQEVQEKTNMAYKAIYSRVSRYRRRGIPLKRFRETTPDDELIKIANEVALHSES